MRITLIMLHDGYHENSGRYPLGLAYLSAHLLAAGHTVDIIDFKFFHHSEAQIQSKLKAIQADLIGLSGLISSYYYLKDISRALKNYHPQTPIVLGGPLVFQIEPLLMLQNPLDAICIGEGEFTLTEMANALEKGQSWADIPGLWIRDEKGQVIPTVPRPQLKDINQIHFPAWDLISPRDYLYEPLTLQLRPTSVLASRGCPSACSFCARITLPHTIRYRDVDNVFEELNTLYHVHGIEHITFVDEYLTTDLRWVRALCQKIIEARLPITWRASSRVRLFDNETYDLFRESGCQCLSFGVEAANREVLKSYNKRQKTEDLPRIYQQLKSRNIQMNFLTIAGAFDETDETLKDTARQLLVHATPARFYYLTPLPGTPIFQQAKDRGLIPDEDEYLSRLSSMDNTFEHIPTLNLTRYTQAEFMAIKEKTEQDTYIMNQLRHSIGLFGEVSLGNLLYLPTPEPLWNQWEQLRKTWQDILRLVNQLRQDYPELKLDLYYSAGSIMAQPARPPLALTKIWEPPASQEALSFLNYFLCRYGLFGEYLFGWLLKLDPQTLQGQTQLWPHIQDFIQTELQRLAWMKQSLKGTYIALAPLNTDQLLEHVPFYQALAQPETALEPCLDQVSKQDYAIFLSRYPDPQPLIQSLTELCLGQDSLAKIG